MPSIAQREAYSEVLDILNHTRKEEVEKISPQFMEFLKMNSLKSYVSKIDYSVNLKEMSLLPQTWTLLALIYRKYWCTEEELKKFDEELKNNEKRMQRSHLEKNHYNNLESIFEKKSIKKQEMTENISQETQKDIMVCKESFFKKIIYKIKSLFELKK